jgi:L-gulono-1,4-lactone dehydrogenase
MADCQSNYTFENWAHTLKFKPQRFCEPDTESKVVDVVKDALARRNTVRATGGGHSWSGFVVTDGTLVRLDKLDKGLVADVPNLRYTVQAGIRLKDLIENLAVDGLAMKNMGSVTEQSIAGATATGTHGTGIRLGNLSTSLVGMKLVTGTGDLLTIQENDAELLDAARVNIGTLGIVTEVTIQCVPLYDLEHNIYWCKFDDVIDELDRLNEENERFLLWWLVPPIGPKDNVMVATMNPPGTPSGLLGQSGSVTGESPERGPLAMDTNDLVSLILKLFPTKPFQRIVHQNGRYDRMLTIPLIPVFHRELEYALPVESAADALRRLRRIFEEGDLAISLPVEVRFVAEDHSMLSPARGRNVCFIGVSPQSNANEIYARVEPVLKEFGGRPHWGKHFSLQRSELEAMYPDSLDRFREIRKELDPEGVFSNTLTRQFFD